MPDNIVVMRLREMDFIIFEILKAGCMSEYPIIAFTALLILAFGIFSRLSEKSVITAQMVFVTIGVLASFFPVAILEQGINAPVVKVLAELTLIIVLFIDASTIDLKKLLKDRHLPMRLLFIGLPLTMVLGLLLAIPLYPGANIWVLALMAFILSPTDAALGQAVVTSTLIPERLRQTINVESGLNDGIALPPILVCLAVLSPAAGEGTGLSYWAFFTLKQFIFGPLIGGLVGWIGGYLVDKSSSRGWMNSTFQRLASIVLAILAYSLAEMVHGNGFIAAFFAGLALGTHTKTIRERIQEFGEAESQALQLFIFLLFGMVMVPLTFPYWDTTAWIYAILSLTIIRMLPVAISLIGTKLSRFTIGFIGWFGPRGIASILYTLMTVIILGPAGIERYLAVIVLTIMLSIFLHGFSAIPLSRIYR